MNFHTNYVKPSLRLQRASRAPCLHVERLSAPLDIQRSSDPYLHPSASTPAASLRRSLPLYLHVATLQRLFSAQYLHTTTSAHLQRAFIALGCLRVCAPASRLQISIHWRYVYKPAALQISATLYLHVYKPTGLHTYVPPRRHTYSAPPALHSSISPRLRAYSEPLELHTSLPPYLHVYTPAARL